MELFTRLRRLLPLALAAHLLLLPGAARAAEKMIVIVLYFDNNSPRPEYNVLQKGLADMLVTDLSAVDELQMVEREKLQQLVTELKLQRSKFFDPATAQKLGKGLGAKYAITGSLAAFDPDMRIDIRLLEVATGKVVMADKVIGAKDRFLDLEQQLAGKFAAGLHLKLAQAQSSGVTDVATLLRYSQGVDAADRGDLKAASQQLAEVVRDAPDFKLAESKYAEILRRIAEAARKRTAGLSENESELMRRTEAGLQTPFEVVGVEANQVRRRLGFRQLRSTIYLAKIHAAGVDAVRTGTCCPKLIPKPAWGSLVSWMKDYVANEQTLLREVKECRRLRAKDEACNPADAEMEDRKRLGELARDTSFDPRFSSVEESEQELAIFIVFGKHGHPEVEVRPTLALLEKGHAEKAYALLDDALGEIARGGGSEGYRESRSVWLLEQYGDALQFLGRKMQAVARWQIILDQYPKNSRFDDIKKKMEIVLGTTREMDTLRAALTSCTQETFNRVSADIGQAFYWQVAKVDGAKGMAKWIDDLQKACAALPTATATLPYFYPQVAEEALLRGDCPLFRQIEAKAIQAAPALKDRLQGYDHVCPANP